MTNIYNNGPWLKLVRMRNKIMSKLFYHFGFYDETLSRIDKLIDRIELRNYEKMRSKNMEEILNDSKNYILISMWNHEKKRFKEYH